MPSHFLTPMLRSGGARYCLRDETTGRVVATDVQGAFDSASRRKGLLGREGLEPDAAIIIAPCNAIHTFFMRFSIDIAFVRRNGEVVKIASKVTPWRIRLAPRAFATIEMAAGVLAERGVRPGHVLGVSQLPAD